MRREVVTDITVGEGHAAKHRWFRIVPDIGRSELFGILEVTGEKILELQKQQGSDWENEAWKHASVTSGLTLEQAFRIIAAKVQRIANPTESDPNSPVGMRRY